MLTAVAIVATGAGLSASGALTPTAGHPVRTDRIHMAADAAAPVTVPVGTPYYQSADLSGGASGTVTDGSTSYPLTCRADTGVRPVVGIVIPGVGSVYVPGSPSAPPAAPACSPAPRPSAPAPTAARRTRPRTARDR